MLKVKSICQRGRLVTGSDRNGRRVTYRLQPSGRYFVSTEKSKFAVIGAKGND